MDEAGILEYLDQQQIPYRRYAHTPDLERFFALNGHPPHFVDVPTP
jgi:hypothetical protein